MQDAPGGPTYFRDELWGEYWLDPGRKIIYWESDNCADTERFMREPKETRGDGRSFLDLLTSSEAGSPGWQVKCHETQTPTTFKPPKDG